LKGDKRTSTPNPTRGNFGVGGGVEEGVKYKGQNGWPLSRIHVHGQTVLNAQKGTGRQWNLGG